MEDLKKCPSLPSNYVSFVQLQERWLKEQERQQREKEVQERKREEEDRENRIRNENGERLVANPVSITRLPFQRNRRNQSVRDRRTAEVSKPRLEKSKIEADVVHKEPQTDESKKKKKKWKKHRKNGKLRVEENLTGGTVQFGPGNKPEGEVPEIVSERNGIKDEIVTERNDRKERIRREFRRNGDNQGVNGKIWEQKVPVVRTAAIGRIFEDLSLNIAKEGSVRSTVEMNGDHRKYRTGSGRFNRPRKSWNGRNCNLVWVKKGEGTDTNVAGI